MHSQKNSTPLSISNLTVHYGDRPAIWDIHYDSPTAALIGILGPNGAGKSTLIKSVLGIVEATSGVVEIFGRPLKQTQSLLAYVPQRESVDWDYPITAWELVSMGLYRSIGWCRRVKKSHRQRAYEALEQVGMQDFAKRQIAELSGGQQQRIFIARALVQDAELYFMDEPFAGVDAKTEDAILTLLRSLRERKKTIFVVHHDLLTAAQTFDYLILLNTTVIAEGPTAKVFTKKHLETTYGSTFAFHDKINTTS